MKKFALFSTFAFLLSALAVTPTAMAAAGELVPGNKFALRHVKVSLSAAQLTGMYAAPVQLIGPQGAGKSIVVTKVTFTLTRTATAFTGGGVVIVQYGSTVNGGGTQALDSTIAAAVINGAAGTTVSVRNGAVISDLAGATIQNAPLYVSNQTAAFATGTGGGVFDVWYYDAF